MSGEAFYSVTAMPSPVGVPVLVLWPDRHGLRGPMEATRITKAWLDQRKIRMERKVGLTESLWFVVDEGEQLILPNPKLRRWNESTPWFGYHDLAASGPVLWRPLQPDKWQAALPEVAAVLDFSYQTRKGLRNSMPWERYKELSKTFPAVLPQDGAFIETRFVGTRQSYTETDAALDAEEMQRDRETVSQENDTKRGRWEIAAQWWRHSVGLRYDDPAALPDDLGKKMVAWRLHRALHFADPFRGYGRKHPAISPALEKLASLSQQDIRDRANNMPPENEIAIPIEMLPADDSDFLKALRWFLALHVPEEASHEPWTMSNQQKVLAYRSLALPRSFRDIGDRLLPQVKADRAKQIYHEAIEHAWLIASGKKENPRLQNQIVLLRERNRAYRRNQEEIIL